MSQALRLGEAAVPGRRTASVPGTAGGHDLWLLAACVFLLGLGLVMVTSASVTVAERDHHDPLYFLWRHLVAVSLGLGVGAALLQCPVKVLQRASPACLFLALVLLTCVLIPGLGHEANGSTRWVRLGPLSIQASEPSKLLIIIYLAGYLVRHREALHSELGGVARPALVLALAAALLLLEPDYGATVVLFATALGMLFLGGASLLRFTFLGLPGLAALGALAVMADYRLERLVSFLDPWSDPRDRGYQLIQALLAIGRGAWDGVGLGGSVLKLSYLPEAHTDFVFAVLAEELGLWGSLAVIAAYTVIVWRALTLAGRAEAAGLGFGAHLAAGIGILIGIQGFINIGVNLGMLPTKGLTMPLVSYGGNSVVTSCAAFALLLRVDREARPPGRRRAHGG